MLVWTGTFTHVYRPTTPNKHYAFTARTVLAFLLASSYTSVMQDKYFNMQSWKNYFVDSVLYVMKKYRSLSVRLGKQESLTKNAI